LANQRSVPEGSGLFLTQRGPTDSPTIIPESPAPQAMLVTDEGLSSDEAPLVPEDVVSALSDPGLPSSDLVASGPSDMPLKIDPDVSLKSSTDELGRHIKLPDLGSTAAPDPGRNDEDLARTQEPVASADVRTPQAQPNPVDVEAPVEAPAEEPEVMPTISSSGCQEGFLPIEGAYCMQSHEFPGIGQKPRTRVTYAEAESICAEQGARLCSVDEFKQACGNRFPYGKRFRRKRCNVAGEFFETGRLFKTGTMRKCVSPHGIFDLSGNVAEWVDGGRTIGGSVKQEGRAVSCTKPKKRKAKYKSSMVGFRCCTDLASP